MKFWIFLSLSFCLLMAACQPAATPTPTAALTPFQTPPATLTVAPTATSPAPPSAHLVGSFGIGSFSDIFRSPDGKRIFVPMNGKELRWYDAKTLQQEGVIILNDYPFSLAEVIFGPDPNIVAFVGGSLLVINLNQKTVTPVRFDQDFNGFDTRFSDVQFSPDARLLFFHRVSAYGTGGNESIDAWDIEHQQQLDSYWYWNPDEVSESLTDPAISPNRNWIAAGYGKLLQIRDIQTGKIVRSISHNNEIAIVAFSKDGSRLASIDKDGVLYLWNSQTGQNLGRFVLNAEKYIPDHLTFSKNDQQVSATFADGTKQIIDLQTRQILIVPAPVQAPVIDPFAMILHHQGYYQSTFSSTANAILSISPDGKTLAVAEMFGSLTTLLWDIETQKLVGILETPKQVYPLNEIKFDPTGKILVGLTNRETLLWKLNKTTQPNLAKILGPANEDYESRQGLSFSPDGKRFAFGHDNHVEIWDTETAQLIKKLNGRDAAKTRFSADGQSIYAGGSGGIQVWDIEKGQLTQSIDIPGEAYVSMIALDYPYVVRLSLSNQTYLRYTAEIWNSETKTLKKTDEQYYSSAVLRKDKDLLFLQDDPSGTVSRFFILQAETGKYLYTSDLAGHDNYYNIDTLEESNFIATISSDWVVKLWNIDELFDYAQKKAISSTATPTHSP